MHGTTSRTSIRSILKRSAGVGVRIFLPMIGLMGIDWGYGFDKVFGSKQYGGSQFHFILGQEF
jgi:outer membrane protein insertion porin family